LSTKATFRKAAEFVAAELRRIGMDNVEIIPDQGHPLLYADWLHAPGKPTVLMYAHYDVQPPDPLDEWHTPPFEPTERNNNIYARGAVDDKGQLWMEVKALESLFKAQAASCPSMSRAFRRRRRSRRRERLPSSSATQKEN
jgi:acetylornithine deacetylase/succinyl-diaminopimelate desuccinylase-like protein